MALLLDDMYMELHKKQNTLERGGTFDLERDAERDPERPRLLTAPSVVYSGEGGWEGGGAREGALLWESIVWLQNKTVELTAVLLI